MMFLAPWALWFLLLGGAVVALYLLKIKRRQATVPALDFWLALAGRTRVHSLWERLKRLLSMLLWLIVVACLVFAIGNPILSLGRIKPRAIAVVFDNSASMQTLETAGDGKTRFELARAAVADLVSRRPVSDEWLLIEAADTPRVLQPWTFEPAQLRQAAEGLKPFGGSGDLKSAVELAGQLLAGKPEPCIVVVSDGAAGALTDIAASDPRVIPWPIGTTRDNLGLARLSVRTDRLRANYQALISVVNASDEKIDTQIVLEIDGSPFGVELVSVEPHSAWEKTVIIDPPARAESADSVGGLGGGGGGGGWVLRATIERPDALMLDNQALAVLEPIRPAIVWLVTPPDSAFFFEQALAAMDPLIWAEESLTMTPERYEQAAAAVRSATPDQPAPIKAPDLIVFNACTPKALPPSGRFVFVGSMPSELPAASVGTLDTPQIFLAPRPHPLTQHITLQGARLAKAQKLTLREPARVLAHSADGDPLVILFEQPDRQSLVFAFDVLESDLPFRNAFPLLLRNAVAFMHEDAPSWLQPRYPIGGRVEPLRPLPPDLKSVTLNVQRDAKPDTVELPITDARFAFTDTGRAAALRLMIAGEPVSSAITLTDPRESRIDPAPAADDPAAKLMLSRKLLGTMPWVMLAALAAAIIALEWMTYHFRWTE